MKTYIAAIGLAAVSAFTLSSCVFAVGNRVPEPTVGRQLADLKEAKRAGAITETEYQTQKAKVLNKPAAQ